MNRATPILAGLLLVLATTTTGRAVDLEIRVDHRAGREPLRLDSLRYPLASAETISFSRLSYLLSDFAVGDGGRWTALSNQFAWIDAGARRTTARLNGVSARPIRALRFTVGLGSTVNGGNPGVYPADHPLNPNLNGLHWSWQGGYIFLALEGLWRQDGGTPDGFSYHLARNPNQTVVDLVLPVHAHTNGVRVDLELDVLALFRGTATISPSRDGTSTHSRDGDPISAALVANLPSAFRATGVGPLATDPAVARPRPRPLHIPSRFTPYPFRVSSTFPLPRLPADNPLTVERVELGRRLFTETRLARDGTISCASCHSPGNGFSDPRPVSIGVEGRTGRRQSMPLANLAWKSEFFWDGRAPSLRAQVLLPIQDHAEMDESLDRVVAKLSAPGADYAAAFERAFGPGPITAEKIALALENHLLTLTVQDSRFDRAMRGEEPLTEVERRGFELFFTEYEPRTGKFGADCFHCHGGALFTDHQFHNNGLDLHPQDIGRAAVTKNTADTGRFATPSLRNVARTAPYMHDGRFRTLEEVVDHYASGVKRGAGLDANLAKHPVAGLPLEAGDRAALVAFLRTLSSP